MGIAFLIIVIVVLIVAVIKFDKSDFDSETKKDKQQLLDEYGVILKKNQQEIEEIKKGVYFKGFLEPPSENGKENFIIGYVFTFIKNNTLSFVEEAIELNEPNKASIDVLKERTQEPIKININLENIQYYTSFYGKDYERKLIITTTDNKKYSYYDSELDELLFAMMPEKYYDEKNEV